MRDLQLILEECLTEIKSLGIPVGEIESIQWANIENGWGHCDICDVGDTLKYILYISNTYLDESISIKELRATICHEILHTCPRCWGHGKTWVKYALKVDAKYGYGISIYKTGYDIINSESPIIHKMVCPNCGGGWGIRQMSDWEDIQNGSCKAFCVWCRNEMKIEF